MATKSLLLSYLLLGIGIAQHPISEGTQTRDAPTFTVPAGFATSTDPPLPPEDWECEFSPKDLIKHNELASRVQQMPLQVLLACSLVPNMALPGCEPLRELEDFLEQKCSNKAPYNMLANTFGHLNSDSSGSWTRRPAGYAVLDHTDPQDRTKCELSPQEAAKLQELKSRVFQQMSPLYADNCICHSLISDWPELTDQDWAKCEVVQEMLDFLRPKCPHLDEVLTPDCASHQQEIQRCTTCPETRDCRALWQGFKLNGLQYWDDNDVNDTSCAFASPDEGERLVRQRNTDTVGFRSVHGENKMRRDADEPYHPALKPIYDDCDVLEDPEEHTRCVLAELQRALCEKEPWIRECQYLESALPDELLSKFNTIDNDLLDEILDADGVILVADDDNELHRPQMSAALEPTETAGLFDWFPLLDLEPFFEECEHADGYMAVEDCVYEKMRDDVCSNPGDKLCQGPLPTFNTKLDVPLLHQDH